MFALFRFYQCSYGTLTWVCWGESSLYQGGAHYKEVHIDIITHYRLKRLFCLTLTEHHSTSCQSPEELSGTHDSSTDIDRVAQSTAPRSRRVNVSIFTLTIHLFIFLPSRTERPNTC